MARRSLPLRAYPYPTPAKHAPCPGCGVVTDSALTTKDGGVRSSAGRGAGTLAGDGFALVQHVRHCSAADALALVRDVYAIQWGRTRQERPANDEPETRRKWPEPMPWEALPQVKPAKAYLPRTFR